MGAVLAGTAGLMLCVIVLVVVVLFVIGDEDDKR